ncbi:MAG: ABC transporter permease, partial [Clostridiales bacterium]|nr:ABC transporter permease [Clostridiales bacterium]
FAKSLKKEKYGYNLDVTLIGLKEDNPHFDAKVKEGKNKLIVSSAMAQKYNLKIGEKIVLTDEEEGLDYAFTVEGITQYSTAFYAFMDIDSMRELFGEDEDYYNVVFSKQELDIPSGRLYAVTSRADIEKSSDVFVNMMVPMITMLSIIAVLIFTVVMYLMMKVMIDRSAFSISLIKIFGFRMNEIRKLYLNGNFYIVAVGAALCIPLSKMAMDAMYPYMIANIACGMNLTFSWQLYALIYGGVIFLYFLINQMLIRRLKGILPAEVLKNRE